MKKTFFFFFLCLVACPVLTAQEVLLDSLVVGGTGRWWNYSAGLNPLRVAPPAAGTVVYYYDLSGDGRPDMLRTLTAGGVHVQWVDDNGNMQIGDISGDLVDDCLMVDRDGDGRYAADGDIVIDWVDTDGDGNADIQIVADYPVSMERRSEGHYMLLLDTDGDNIFNYMDWNTFQLRCWLHHGESDFFEDYHGNSTFLKVHNSPALLNDVRLNWENPFRFIDSDGDGLTEMTVRLCDRSGSPSRGRNPDGVIDWAAICVDLDNDNSAQNPFDLDMTVNFCSESGTSYTKYTHVYEKLRGLPEADVLFMDPVWRQNTELIFPLGDECFDFIFKDAVWNRVNFTFDEDDDCGRWERVELYEPLDLYAVGAAGGGLDNHRQSDAAGDRGEWDMDNSGGGRLYVSPMDGKIHLYGAEWGAWRIDQNALSYQGMGGIYDVYGPGRMQFKPEKFPVVKYEDSDSDGFFDTMRFDWDADGIFDEEVSLGALGLCGKAPVLDISRYGVKDYNRLFRKVARKMWKQAKLAEKTARRLGLETGWYALYGSPKSLWQKYDHGFWMQLYIYHDIVDYARRNADSALEERASKAYFSSSWNKI